MPSAAGIGVGLVGYGLAGRLFHAPYIAAVDGLRITAIATSDPGRSASAHAEHPDAAVVPTVDALLDRPDVEIVVVVTPNRWHAPIGTRALEAGRHVVVDKPIAMDVAEAAGLIEAAERSGRILTVYQNRRWDGDVQTLRSLMDGGRLGAVDSLEARFERWMPVGREWRELSEEAGGPHRDLGAHLVDQSLLLLGPARGVFAQMDRRRPDSLVDDSTFVAIDHADGVHSRLGTSLMAARPGPRMRLRGTTAEYVKDDLDPQEVQLLAGERPGDPGFGEEPPERWGRLYASDGSVETVPTMRGDYSRFYELLRLAVQGGGERPVDPLDSLRGLRVLEAAERSARSGAVETVTEA
jgi:scyllo-inositol 2-dehydrogenase (NADP+)